jgi:protein-disulfide isomerase
LELTGGVAEEQRREMGQYKTQATLSLETLKPQIKQFVRNAEVQQARQKYEESLRAKADISILLRPPSVEVAYDPSRVTGNPHAPVTIVEFGDYQCPYCKKTAGSRIRSLMETVRCMGRLRWPEQIRVNRECR